MKRALKVDHRRARQPAYPPIGDQLDAIWKALEQVGSLPPETRDMLERVKAVKKRYPKRDANRSSERNPEG